MKFKSRYVRFYLPLTILGFFIITLMLGGTVFYMKRPVLGSRPALAEDANSPIPAQRSLNSQNVGVSVEILERKRAEIETERRQLERERKQLTALKREIEAKVTRLSEIQDSIQRKLDKQKMMHDNKIKHLIKIYTTMAPKKAAALIDKLDMGVIVELFSKMKGEHVGQILPYVSAEKAAKICEQLAKRN